MSNSTDVIEVQLENNTYRAQYDFATIAPCAAVVDLLQTITNEDCRNLQPLYEVVDPDALNQLVKNEAKNQQNCCRVTFLYQELTVTVRSNGIVSILPHSDAEGKADG